MLKIITGIADHGQGARWQSPIEAKCEFGPTNTS
jgi:hypothetical protein